MTTDLQLESQSWAAQQDDAGEEMLTRDLDAELAEANAAYEQWLMELPRESRGARRMTWRWWTRRFDFVL